MNSEPIALVQFPLDRGLAGDARRTSELEERVAAIFKLLRQPVFRYVVGMVGDRDGAEDVMQEVFLRLYCSVRKGETISNCRSWVFHVAYRLAVDLLRANGKAESLEGSELASALERILEPGADPERRLLEQEQNDRLLSAWSCLSPQERHCLNLRAEGLSYSEIASVLGIRSSSVGSFLARGITKIKKATHV
ncbi:MAG: sigma-70 family RNA polymerase sigma factor [Acidobacteria bacterium]|nr:sigma-70 family RNA polymerase sigma factor [Acidobacteriota bacterium]MCI0620543.1 sigma-70 family RNA polymerase sigma factor [Acidobacteriota bacterium]